MEVFKTAKIEKSELTSEMIAAAMQCKTADELIALAKAGGTGPYDAQRPKRIE